MTLEKVISIIAEVSGEDEANINAETVLKDLDLDSLSIQEILMDIEDESGVTIEPTQIGETVGDLVALIEAGKKE